LIYEHRTEETKIFTKQNIACLHGLTLGGHPCEKAQQKKANYLLVGRSQTCGPLSATFCHWH